MSSASPTALRQPMDAPTRRASPLSASDRPLTPAPALGVVHGTTALHQALARYKQGRIATGRDDSSVTPVDKL